MTNEEHPITTSNVTGWQPIETAPKDGTILHLLVRPGHEELDPLTSFHDSREPYETIGFNQLSDTTIDEWQFAGWDWCQDCITDGHGDVIGWRHFCVGNTPTPAPQLQVKPLEWRRGYCDDQVTISQATTLGGLYQVRVWKGDVWLDKPGSKSIYPSTEDAVAAAQADYERLILSALVAPAPTEQMRGDE